MTFFDHEAEQMILSAMMLDPPAADRLSSALSASDFERDLHRRLFANIGRLIKSGATADTLTVLSDLRRSDTQAAVEVAEWCGCCPSVGNIDYYVGVVRDLSIKRSTFAAVDAARVALAQKSSRGIDVSSDLEKDVSAINAGSYDTNYRHVSKYLGDVCDELDWAISTMGKIRGIEAPYDGLEDITGFRNGEYIVIAARPSIGKTALALNMAEICAVRRKIPTGFFSLEMSATQLNLRMVSSMCNFNNQGIMTGLYRSPADKEKIRVALETLAESPLFIDETGAAKLSEIRTKARRMVKLEGVKIIFIDYIGLINAEQPNIPRHEQIAEISRTMKDLAKELKIPVVVLSQLKRDTEGKRPTLDSLAETRSIEQDADVIMFIHRERPEDVTPERREEIRDAIPTELIVAKNRNGPTGICNLIYKPRITMFFDMEIRNKNS